MAGVISLSHPVPSTDAEDLNINLNQSESDSDDHNRPVPNGAQLALINVITDKEEKDQEKCDVTTTPLKTERSKKTKTKKHISFSKIKSTSEKGDEDVDTHSHSDVTSHSHSHMTTKSERKHKESPYLPAFHGLRICYRPNVYRNDYKNVFKEIIAGIIVSFAQVPESISFAMLANLPPIFGLHSAWLIGGLVSITGGRPGMISGATGGMGAILGPIMLDPTIGIDYLPYILIFSGIAVTICGICGIGKFARLIPQTVMIGFLNGLAIIIFKSQFHMYHHAHTWHDYLSVTLLALITFCVVQFLPKLTKLVPSSLAAILVATLVEYLIIRLAIGHHTPLIGEMAEVQGELPQVFWHNSHEYFDLPSLNSSQTWSKLIIPIILVTLVSIIEDAMTMDVVTELTHTKSKHLPRHTKQQQVAMGLANVFGGVLSTMGGHGAIGLSMVSCHSGSTGSYRISGLTASILVFIIVMFASPLIDAIPYAALVGIMLAVVGHTFEWRSINMVISASLPRKLRRKLPQCMRHTKIRRGDAIVIVIVTIFVVVVNLAYAVILGIVIASLIYTWYSGFSFHVHKEYVHMDHLKDRRHIRKFSDFHIHYHKNGHGRGREQSVETIDTLDPHYIDHYDDHHSDHHRSYSDLPSFHRGHGTSNGHDLIKTSSFSADNKFTELHEIRDIKHLDTFMGQQEQHMEMLKEAENAADEEPTPKVKLASENKNNNSFKFNDIKPILLNDLENIKSINDTFKSNVTDKTDNSLKRIPTFEATNTVHGIEHGTLRKLQMENFGKSFEKKLSDEENENERHERIERLSDCTNPDDIESFVGRMSKRFNKDYILVYHFEGPLFFGNCRNLLNYFDPKNDPDRIEIHLRDACIYDFSAMNALNQIGQEYDNLGKQVHLRHINDKSHKLIAKANHLVKYFSYEDTLNINEPKNRNKINVLTDNSVTNNHGHGEREISKSYSLLQLSTPAQYRFRQNARYV